MRGFSLIALLAIAGAALAQEGSRIRLGPTVPPPAGTASAPIERDAQRCDAMQGSAKDRCLRDLRAAAAGAERSPHAGPNPESAGAGASSGADLSGPGSAGPGAVGGAAGGSAPR
jgi:hypothetical protein